MGAGAEAGIADEAVFGGWYWPSRYGSPLPRPCGAVVRVPTVGGGGKGMDGYFYIVCVYIFVCVAFRQCHHIIFPTRIIKKYPYLP